MQYIFRVTVPFIATSRETLTQSVASRLPSGETELPHILLRETADGRYVAVVEIESPNPNVAKSLGVGVVEQLLQVLAIWNDLFVAEISSVTAEVIREVNPVEPTVTREGNTVSVAISSTIFFSAHLGLVKKKGSLEFESKALAGAERWPAYLRRGIDLNYSALRTATDEVRFLLLTSALEVLAWKKLGSPETLLKSKLEQPNYDSFKEEFEKFLEPWGLNRDEISRLCNHLLAANKEPVPHHLVSYLESTNVQGFTVQEVARWWQMRGRIAHGEAASAEELQPALNHLTQAVQSALREELSRL